MTTVTMHTSSVGIPQPSARLAEMEQAQTDAFEAFVKSRTPALLRAAYLLTGDQFLAEDLVQTALSRTHQSWGHLHDPANAEAYTRKVMYHLQVSWWRRRKVAESMTGDVPEPRRIARPESSTAITMRLVLRRALQHLTPRQRAVLVLRFFEDHTEQEAADVLGVNIGTIKSTTARAIQRLKVVSPELAEIWSARGANQ
jgi:RNA polymerase sigma-70 factor (sigma-E family)